MIDMIRRSSELIDVDYNTSCSLINVPLDKNLRNLVNDNLDVLDCISDLRIPKKKKKKNFLGWILWHAIKTSSTSVDMQ